MGGLATPVAAHIAVREVPEADRFGVFEGDDVADHAVEKEEFAEEDVVRAVAEDMADGEDAGGEVRGEGAVDGEAVVQRQGEGLLAEDVETEGGDGVEDLDVSGVEGADEDPIDADSGIIVRFAAL